MGATPQTRLDTQAAAEYQAAQALARKERSERILSDEGVTISRDLPPLEAGQPALRSRDEIAYRALCLLMTAIKAERMDHVMVRRVVQQYGLEAHFSPTESEFIRDLEPSAEQSSRFSWRYESAWVLLWALGYVKKLGVPRSTCDVSYAVACMRDRNTQAFIADAKLRPIDQILDQADLMFRYRSSILGGSINNGSSNNGSSNDASSTNQASPVNLITGILCEWRYALNWLIRYHDQDWDEVTTETGSCDG